MLIISRIKDGHLNYGLDKKISLGMKLPFQLTFSVRSCNHLYKMSLKTALTLGALNSRIKVDHWNNDKNHCVDHYLIYLCSKLEFISLFHLNRVLAN